MTVSLNATPVGQARSAELPQPAADASPEGSAPGWAFDPQRAVNAAQRGLAPDAIEDQSAPLAELIAEVAARDDVDTVYLPAGTYRIAGEVRLSAGVHLIGDGAGRTVLERSDETGYLLVGKRVEAEATVVGHLTLSNPRRTVMLQDCRGVAFQGVEFRGGMVRFERCATMVIDRCVFNENLGKAGYASADCEEVRITRSRFHGIENGGINLSGHRRSYVAHNVITADALIDSGYAGIRLPNLAHDNLVEHNVIENHGRGLFVLSGSTGNTLRFNTVRGTTLQGVFVQSAHNRIEHNTVIDAGDEAIYVTHGHAEALPFPSPGEHNHIVGNLVFDTRPHDADRFVGLKIFGNDNHVRGNLVSVAHGRRDMEIAAGAGHRVEAN